MASPCNELRERYLAEIPLEPREELPTELSAHLSGCDACAVVWKRAQAFARALAELPRIDAPEQLEQDLAFALSPEGRERRAAAILGELERPSTPRALDGGVVAAIHAGHRQDRAAAALFALTRQEAPTELEQRLQDEPSRWKAPDVLDRLVAEELSDPAKSMVRRFAGRLPRMEAPAALDQFIEDTLSGRLTTTQGQSQGATEPAPRRLRLGRSAALAAAATLVAMLWVGRGLTDTGDEPLALTFEVQRAESVADLAPGARGWVTGIAGGILDVPAARRSARRTDGTGAEGNR